MITTKTTIENRDFTLGIRAVLWLLGNWAMHSMKAHYAGLSTRSRRK
jgi:hypothetical protein